MIDYDNIEEYVSYYLNEEKEKLPPELQNLPIGNWDVSQVTFMGELFNNQKTFNEDISGWNVSKVETMKGMFKGCDSFNQNIGRWKVSSVINMKEMFYGCKSFDGNISEWNVSSVKNMEGMFYGCKSFNQNIGGWDVSNVINMKNMFKGCDSFNQDISGWDVKDMLYLRDIDIFDSNSLLPEQFKPKFNKPVTAVSYINPYEKKVNPRLMRDTMITYLNKFINLSYKEQLWEASDIMNQIVISFLVHKFNSCIVSLELDTTDIGYNRENMALCKKQINKCLKNKSKRNDVILIYLVLRFEEDAHANALIYKPKLNTIEWFEPHGDFFNSDPDSPDVIKLTEMIQELSISLGSTLIPSNEVCPNIDGVQAYEGSSKIHKFVTGGYCALWSFLLIDLTLKFPQYSTKQINDFLLNDLVTNDSEKEKQDILRKLIVGFNAYLSNELHKYTDVTLEDIYRNKKDKKTNKVTRRMNKLHRLNTEKSEYVDSDPLFAKASNSSVYVFKTASASTKSPKKQSVHSSPKKRLVHSSPANKKKSVNGSSKKQLAPINSSAINKTLKRNSKKNKSLDSGSGKKTKTQVLIKS